MLRNFALTLSGGEPRSTKDGAFRSPPTGIFNDQKQQVAPDANHDFTKSRFCQHICSLRVYRYQRVGRFRLVAAAQPADILGAGHASERSLCCHFMLRHRGGDGGIVIRLRSQDRTSSILRAASRRALHA